MVVVVYKKDKFYTFDNEFTAINFCSPKDLLIDEKGDVYEMQEDCTFIRSEKYGREQRA